jgi:WD40 repeat protein
MLITCSNDGTGKLINPRTFEVVRIFNYGKPCRGASISPLYESTDMQKFHALIVGGQDAKEVALTKEGGFEMKLMSIIFNESLADITGHFGTVHTVAFSPDGHSFASGSEDGYVHYHRFVPEYFTKRFE